MFFRCYILFFLILVFVFTIPLSHAQKWVVYTQKLSKDSIYYTFHDFSSDILKNGLTFFPLSFVGEDSIVKSSAKPFNNYKDGILPINKSAEQKYYSWSFTLPEPLIVTDSVYLYYNLYTIGIDSLSVWIKSGDKYFKTERTFETDYFQYPEAIPLRSFMNEKDSLSCGALFDQITLLIHKKEAARKWECIVGDIQLYSASYKKIPARGMFFYELTGNLENYPKQDADKYYNHGLGLIPIFNEPVSNQYFFELISTEEREKAILDLLYLIIDKYPYFQERNIDKNIFLSEISSNFYDSGKSFQEKLQMFKTKVTSMHDGHFFFPKEPEENLPKTPELPFRIGRHFKGFFITAVSNTCPEGITVGMKITHINSIDIYNLYDSLRLTPHNLQFTLNRVGNDTILLRTEDGRYFTVVKQINVEYSSNYYKPLQEFRFIDDKYAYYSFKGWTTKEYIYFTNKIREIGTYKIEAFIFDLRNNPGGDEITAVRMASMFIGKPCIFQNSSYFHQGELIKESMIVIPNPEFKFAGKKVIILINRKTACASEIFIANMKKYADAWVIGQEKTAGAYAAVQSFYLPENIRFSTNMINKIEFPDIQIENTGISPDLYVYPYDPEDLFPHNDKILKQTLKYLKFAE
ncbi:MAG: S41 family peptidase [Bacteroidales bacterium]|jgi:hypothetical protein|nr:S41 family peptidase [Bacteroidales bacterium]